MIIKKQFLVKIVAQILIVSFLAIDFSYGQGSEMEFYLKGIEFAVQEKYEEAQRKFEEALKINLVFKLPLSGLAIIEDMKSQRIKKETAVHIFKGLDFANKNMYDESIIEFTKAIENDPNYAQSYADRGNSYAKKGLNEQALKDYNNSLALFMKNQSALDRIIFECNKRLEINPQHVDSLRERGVTYAKKGLYTQAISDFDKALEINPVDEKAYYYKGSTLRKADRFKESIESYKKAIQYGAHLGESFAKLVNYEMELSQHAIEVMGTFESYHTYYYSQENYAKGMEYGLQGKFEEAKKEFEKAVEYYPSSYMVLTRLNLKIIEDAINGRIDKENAVIIFKGLDYVDKNMWDKAIDEFNKVINHSPDYYAGYLNRGKAYNLKGLKDQALTDLNKAIKLNPTDSISYQERASIYLKEALYDQAIAEFDKAIEIDPNNAVAYQHRGLLYYGKDLHDQAISSCNKAIEINPKYSEAYYYKGLACEKANRKQEAVDAYKGVIKYTPHRFKAVIESVKKRIEELEGK